ncbi:cytochrome-c oxidase, cbb3-type subunit III [Spongiibacter taiwanensis]|uniref:cytochrome-c oxidase, cbb3-type subunit III n=1 Tax=Spongiibacter taiwanensis TaxID=1748242 RepID=UPI0020366585|nr:cytochrome-c oxidase, cbb3-type subunit III [Spongiibacter taiwanensis]USA43031.1 cytochrome-c oxidase, cbb3-type subunit III [Spongiibacter taiwanensis]
MTNFWSAWIIVITAVSFVLICWLLFSNRKIDKGGETTGHIYDGIEEFDNPLPAWWIKLFVVSIVFGAGYLLAYPGLGSFPGLLKWSSTGQWQAAVDEANAKFEDLYSGFEAQPIAALATDRDAMRIGRRLFDNNCAICHGANAEGGYGFPNLTDNDWLYGDAPDQIVTSIRQGRSGLMPAWASILGDEGLDNMTRYVASLSDDAASPAPDTRQQFVAMCSGCHGADGKGNIAMGAPDLTDNIWLYGGDAGKIKQSIANGRAGKMPAHGDILGDAKIHLLAAYVYHLSQGAGGAK